MQKSRVTGLLICCFLWVLLSVQTAFASNVLVFINGKQIDFGNVGPFIENGRTLVPIRFIAENMDVQVNWVPQHELVQLTADYLEIDLFIGKTTARVNESNLTLDVVPKIVDDRTFVPLRFIAEAFGAKVDWEEATSSVFIFPK